LVLGLHLGQDFSKNGACEPTTTIGAQRSEPLPRRANGGFEPDSLLRHETPDLNEKTAERISRRAVLGFEGGSVENRRISTGDGLDYQQRRLDLLVIGCEGMQQSSTGCSAVDADTDEIGWMQPLLNEISCRGYGPESIHRLRVRKIECQKKVSPSTEADGWLFRDSPSRFQAREIHSLEADDRLLDAILQENEIVGGQIAHRRAISKHDNRDLDDRHRGLFAERR